MLERESDDVGENVEYLPQCPSFGEKGWDLYMQREVHDRSNRGQFIHSNGKKGKVWGLDTRILLDMVLRTCGNWASVIISRVPFFFF